MTDGTLYDLVKQNKKPDYCDGFNVYFGNQLCEAERYLKEYDAEGNSFTWEETPEAYEAEFQRIMRVFNHLESDDRDYSGTVKVPGARIETWLVDAIPTWLEDEYERLRNKRRRKRT